MKILEIRVPSLAHTKLSAASLLFVYITIYSMLNILGFSSTEHPGLFAIWQIVSLFILLTMGVIYTKMRKVLSSQMLVFYLLLVLSTLLTLSSTIQEVNLLRIFTSFIPLMIGAIFYIANGKASLSPEDFKRLILYFIYFVAFASIYNLIMNTSSVLQFTSILDPYQYNLQSFFENRNAFAYLLAFSIPMLSYLRSTKNISKLAYISLILLMSVNLLMTLSRGGMIFAITSSVLFYAMFGGLKKLALYLMLLATIALFAFNYFGDGFIAENIVRSDAGTTHRDIIQQDGIDYFNNHNMLFGSGESIRSSLKDEYGFTSLHNTYLDMLVTGGAMKLTIYGILVLLVVHSIKKISRYDRETGSLVMALLITYLLYSAIETATPFLLSPTSAATTVFIFIVPIYLLNYYNANNTAKIKERLAHDVSQS